MVEGMRKNVIEAPGPIAQTVKPPFGTLTCMGSGIEGGRITQEAMLGLLFVGNLNPCGGAVCVIWLMLTATEVELGFNK